MFGDLTLDRVHATGHAVWLLSTQPWREDRLQRDDPRGGPTRWPERDLLPHRLPAQALAAGEVRFRRRSRPQGQNGPVQREAESVTHVWAADATLFDTGGDMDRATSLHAGPGAWRRALSRTDAASLRQGVPADRIVTWQKSSFSRTRFARAREIAEKVLILTGKPWIFDRLKQSLAQGGRHDRDLAGAQAGGSPKLGDVRDAPDQHEATRPRTPAGRRLPDQTLACPERCSPRGPVEEPDRPESSRCRLRSSAQARDRRRPRSTAPGSAGPAPATTPARTARCSTRRKPGSRARRSRKNPT